MFNAMLTAYEKLSVADSYIIGFAYANKLYMVKSHTLPTNCIKLDKASRNQGFALRVRINKATKKELLNSAVCVGMASDIESDKYNRGEMFEKIVTEYFGQEWKKDNIPFWQDGDITVNGEKIQIKFDKASLATEKSLANLA